MAHAGELAAITVSLLWSVGALLFAWASARIGAAATNLFRISIAAIVLGVAGSLLDGAPLPGAGTRQLALLAASGLVGLCFGDYCYFRALLLVGPRRATLLASQAPVFTVLLGWLVLDERLGGRALGGIAVTLLGAWWVVFERSAGWAGREPTVAGVLYGLGAALGQAGGLILAKYAMAGLSALATASVRMTAAGLFLWGLALAGGRVRRTVRSLADRRLLLTLVAAALVGPVAGVWLSLFAIQRTTTAIAATLMSLVPVTVLPLVWLVHGERPTVRAAVGATVAVLGVILLVTRPG